MTIEISKSFTIDITQENEIYNFLKSLPPGIKLGASSWILKICEGKDKSRLKALKAIVDRLSQIDPKINFWCWLGDSSWQNDTRVIRHKKLWKRMKDRGISIPASEFYEEVLVNEDDGKLKFFGTFALTDTSIENAINLIGSERYVYIVALPSSFDIRKVLDICSDDFLLELLRIIANINGYLFKVVGEFDDIETGFVVFGAPSRIESLKD